MLNCILYVRLCVDPRNNFMLIQIYNYLQNIAAHNFNYLVFIYNYISFVLSYTHIIHRDFTLILFYLLIGSSCTYRYLL